MDQTTVEQYAKASQIKRSLKSIQAALENDNDYPLRMSEMIATCLLITESYMEELKESINEES